MQDWKFFRVANSDNVIAIWLLEPGTSFKGWWGWASVPEWKDRTRFPDIDDKPKITPPNSPVDNSIITQDFLDQFCAEISEEVARVIHPRLFEHLDEYGVHNK